MRCHLGLTFTLDELPRKSGQPGLILHPAVQSAAQGLETVLVEHYISVLCFKPKNWDMCHQPATLEEFIVLMEPYASAEADVYVIPNSWKRQTKMNSQG